MEIRIEKVLLICAVCWCQYLYLSPEFTDMQLYFITHDLYSFLQ